jgi:hypothetical protein
MKLKWALGGWVALAAGKSMGSVGGTGPDDGPKVKNELAFVTAVCKFIVTAVCKFITAARSPQTLSRKRLNLRLPWLATHACMFGACGRQASNWVIAREKGEPILTEATRAMCR